MRVTKAEILRIDDAVSLPEPWSAAWWEPSGRPRTTLGLSIYRLTTDEGLVGIGPYTGGDPQLAIGQDPFEVGRFWARHMSGVRAETSEKGASGLEIALWDLIGKAAGQPLHRLLGSRRDGMPVYAATSRLLPKEALVDEALALEAQGFRAIKLRLHRQEVRDDLDAVVAVRGELGDSVALMVDANQNNYADGYPFWSRLTAQRVAQELDALGLYFLEEPLPRTDVEGLAEIAASVGMYIAGGEHTPTVYDWRPYLQSGAYDVLQPDLVMGGNLGITGGRKVAEHAEAYGRLVIPHVLMSGAAFPLCLAASLHAMASVDNCPMVEYPYDPPVLTQATTQSFVTEPLHIDSDGCIALPAKPGLGLELDEDQLRNAEVTTVV
jgi:D-galactarolactone cycloisomerase